MRTIIIFIFAIVSASNAWAAPLKPQDVADLNKISAYLNAITSLQSNFVQV